MERSYPLIITISRQIGSGGSYIGKRLSEKLNLFFADREIIREAAKKLSVYEDEIDSIDEKRSVWDSFLRSFVSSPDLYLPSEFIAATDEELFKTESEIILRIANERPAVIVGRGGAFILRSHPNHISIFFHGDVGFRTAKIKELYNLPDEEARKIVARTDKSRALYFKTFTNLDWSDAKLYNLSIDTSKIGYDKTVDLIMNYIDLKKSQ